MSVATRISAKSRSWFVDFAKDKELFVASILMIFVFSIAGTRFFTLDNIANILRSVSIGGILTLGLSFVMITGDFDLSFGSATGLLVVIEMIMLDQGVNMWLVFLVMIVLGLVWQFINAMLVVKVRMPAFIATIATWNMARGLIFWITKGKTFYGDYPDAFAFVGRENILVFLPTCAIIFAVLAFFAYMLGNHTKFGRHLYAVGGNPEAARYAGIDSDTVRILAFLMSGLAIGVSAIILGSELCCAPAGAGDAFQMQGIAAAYLGATVFKPGSVNIGGSILGSLLLVVIENGLVMMNVPFYYKYLIQGLIIVGAVSFITIKKRNSSIAIQSKI